MRQALAQVGEAAQAQCGGRAITPDKLHVTLFFLGDVPRHRAAALKATAGVIPGSAFDLTFDVLDHWRHNGIVWLGTKHCPEALAALAARFRAALIELGFEAEPRPYVPHVTLVRNARRPPRGLAWDPIHWAVHDFALVESVQAEGQARYDVLARWPLLV